MKLALGTVQFGLDYGIANESGRVTEHEAGAILKRAQSCGVDTLDTAIAYGDSENVLGRLGLTGWKTITKLPAVPDDCSDVMLWIRHQLHLSMNRLGVTQLYGVLLHRPGQLIEHIGPDLYAALLDVQAQGLVSKIGVSIYAPAELDALLNSFHLDLVQAPLSILDRRLLDSGWAKRLNEAAVEVHARSAFLQGLLLMPVSQRPVSFNRWIYIWKTWDHWLCKVGLTPLQACLRFFNDLPEIDRVVVGVDTASQLNEILLASTGKLSSLPEFDPLEDERLINPATWDNLWV